MSPKPIHIYISFRPFKHFNKAAFFNDLHWAPFTEVLNCTDPDKALATWYSVYITVVNRHAPLKRKRVKHPKLPPWLNKDIKETMAERDKLKREKCFSEYKKLRNKVKNLVRRAKKEYFRKLTERDNSIASVWRALNAFTKGHRSTSADIPKILTANVFNNHFLSVTGSLTEPRTNVYECSNLLHDFCKQKTSGQDTFVIPYLSVSELGKYISRLENKKSSGLDGISTQLLKLSLPYIIDSHTYVFYVCIEKKRFSV